MAPTRTSAKRPPAIAAPPSTRTASACRRDQLRAQNPSPAEDRRRRPRLPPCRHLSCPGMSPPHKQPHRAILFLLPELFHGPFPTRESPSSPPRSLPCNRKTSGSATNRWENPKFEIRTPKFGFRISDFEFRIYPGWLSLLSSSVEPSHERNISRL